MLPSIIRSTVRAHQASNIVYLNNPKVGCSTVKLNLWKSVSPETFKPGVKVHEVAGSPFTTEPGEPAAVEAARVFSFVRNPFVRVVSAYLDKIARKEKDLWPAFARRYRLDPQADLAFDAFVRLISRDNPEELDRHWRPQHINLMYPFVVPNVLGKLECMDEELPLVLEKWLGIPPEPPQRRNVHATGAAAKYRSFFSSIETQRLVVSLYYEDFLRFGYSPDVEAPMEGKPIFAFSDHRHPRLAGLVAFHAAGTAKDRRPIVAELIRQVEQDALARDDGVAAAWLIHARLETAGPGGVGVQALIRDNLPAILAGPEFLRRTAGRLAAAYGAWALCSQIADASLRFQRPA